MFSPFKRRDEGNILEIGKSEQYHTVDELIRRSHPNSVYYTFLVVSSVIITAGLLIDNTAIVIGGMLVTPVLTPILLFSLGLSILEFGAVRKAGFLMVVSFLIIIAISWVLATFLGSDKSISFLQEDPGKLFNIYFVVALASGVAATFAWARKEMTDVLPGVAMAVTLVPPAALIGISLNSAETYLAQYYLYIFLFNLMGLVVGSFLVYTLLKFYKTRREVEKEIEE
jgi:uncharacterized hydrophobic protein (TIGR00271 family)